MRAGILRHRVIIQAKTESRDAQGGVTYNWTNDQTRWAEVRPLEGRELWQARQAQMQATLRCSMRHYAGLTTQHRMIFGSRVLNIESVTNIGERDIETVALCIDSGVTTISTSTSSSTSSSTTTTPP